jgi:hypothetical protein
MTNNFKILENLYHSRKIRKVWGTIRENITISAKERLGYW